GRNNPLREPPARPAHLWRGQGVAALHVGLGTQVLEIDPDRWSRSSRHSGHEVVRWVTAEGFDHDLTRLLDRWLAAPRNDLHARLSTWRHPRQGARIVNP